jgi:hypothetical protein
MACVSHHGMMRPTPLPFAGQIAPKMYPSAVHPTKLRLAWPLASSAHFVR